ncbi:PIR Superfamily Protein [Plasmodium ovale curtisi]|uniref:PIR Superfamily Protein n=1 Tax=Plasmodium ovale curtisi TaxID=864141 RepID=A0A1A8XAW1_PLAOA|nr:PIR Superfamily Protein [Plasmodium ovale curtisi]
MEATDDKICKFSSDEYYSNFNSVQKITNIESACDSNETIISGGKEVSIKNLLTTYNGLKDICYKLESNLYDLKDKCKTSGTKNHCRRLQHWLEGKVIDTVENRSIITYIMLFYKIWGNILEKVQITNKNDCQTKYFPINVDYYIKWKKMYDYNLNYKEVQWAFQNEEDCKENCRKNCKQNYCAYILNVFNIYKEFEKVCTGESTPRCPEYWEEFQKNYLATSDIESKCKEVYDKLGFYKVKMTLDIEGEEKYVEQYESTYMFSFFEKLIGYSIKYYLSKTMHYSRYIVLPIILILLFYFFMKKLSFFGSKIAPKADDMRKMWRNVQGVTNPATLLNPMKPPGGGNKIGLPYMPK